MSPLRTSTSIERGEALRTNTGARMAREGSSVVPSPGPMFGATTEIEDEERLPPGLVRTYRVPDAELAEAGNLLVGRMEEPRPNRREELEQPRSLLRVRDTIADGLLGRREDVPRTNMQLKP